MRQLVKISESLAIDKTPLPPNANGIAWSAEKNQVAYSTDDGHFSCPEIEDDYSRYDIWKPIAICSLSGSRFIVWQEGGDLAWSVDLSSCRSKRMTGKTSSVFWNSLKIKFPKDKRVSISRLPNDVFVVASARHNAVLACMPNGELKRLIGNSSVGFSIADCPAESSMNVPAGVACDKEQGVLLVCDSLNSCVRRFEIPRGFREISPIGMPGESVQSDGNLSSARFEMPGAADCLRGKMALCDGSFVRVVDLRAGVVSTVYRSAGILLGVAMAGRNVCCLEES